MTPCIKRSAQSNISMSPAGKSALKILNALAFEALKARYPEIRPELLPMPKYRDNSANALTKSIIAWIRLSGGQAERISTTGRPIDGTRIVDDVLGHRRQIGSVKWFPGTSTKGSSDVSATIAGKSVKIEVKIGRDRQSEHQVNYQKSVEAAGGLYFIASTFQQFYDWFKQTFE